MVSGKKKLYNLIVKLSNKALLVLILAGTFMLAGYLFLSSDERRIKKLFREEIKSFEAENLDALMSGVSYNYQDEYGFNYLYLKEFFKKFFSLYSDLRVEYENLKVDISDNKARVEMSIRIIGTSGEDTGYIAGDIKTPLHFIFNLEKKRFKWFILKTEITNFHFSFH